MQELYQRLANLVRDESGAEVVEYALVAGMISLVAIGTIGSVGQKVLNYWKALDHSLGF